MKNQFSKLWAISFLLIITFAALIYWGIRSYQEFSSALERLTQPDLKTELLNSIFKYVNQTEMLYSNRISPVCNLYASYMQGNLFTNTNKKVCLFILKAN